MSPREEELQDNIDALKESIEVLRQRLVYKQKMLMDLLQEVYKIKQLESNNG